jgi:hypothetical protein
MNSTVVALRSTPASRDASLACIGEPRAHTRGTAFLT